MNGYEFTLRIIEALAWPITTLLLIFLIRRELPSVIQSLSKLKIGSLEAEFKDALSEQEGSEPESPVTDKELIEAMPEVLSIAEISPKASIPHAWAQLEHSMIHALSKLQGFKDGTMGYQISKQIEILRENDYITPRDAEILHELRRLRNRVSHEKENSSGITFTTAKDYASKCAHYVNVFNALESHG